MMTREELLIAQKLAREDYYYFVRYMFKARHGFKWHQAPHHKMICDALMKVFRGETSRLVINLPPRYSKTELAVVNFIPWGIGMAPDAEFIHTSYAARLAATNSWQAREIAMHEDYHLLFPNVGLRDDTQAKDEWRTTAGGCVYAAGAQGTITGYGAGKVRPGFGGCFPYDELVHTEKGLIKIGDIVTRGEDIRVWSYNFQTGQEELQPVDTLWHNPPNEILEVTLSDGTVFQCTPNHKIFTSQGWMEAQYLSDTTLLPDMFELSQGQPGSCHSFFSADRQIAGDCDDVFGMFGLEIPNGVGQVFRDGYPCLPEFNLANNAWDDTEFVSEFNRRLLTRENLDNLVSCKFGAGSPFEKRECPVSDSVLHVLGLGSISEVCEPVVEVIPIKVSGFHSRWPRANESFQDKLVNENKMEFGILGQCDPEILFTDFRDQDTTGDFLRNTVFVNDSSVKAFDIPLITDSVKSFKSWDRHPVFIRRIGHVDHTFCLEVRNNNNFYVAQKPVLVSNCIIIDDPHKPGEADSDVIRPQVIRWFQDTLESRKNTKDTPIILIMQRLHEEDLAGWLLAGGNGEHWDHINLPALQEDGTALWEEKHSVEDLLRMQEAKPWSFSSQYQQKPVPPAGGIFKPDKIEVVDSTEGVLQWVRAWDLAATKNDGDWTVGTLIGKTPANRFVIKDVTRFQGTPDQVEERIVSTAKLDGPRVKIKLPQDPGQAGKAQITYLTRALGGFSVVSAPVSGDKVTRAEPFAAQVNVGSVMMKRGDWNYPFTNELRHFPFGKNDDQVDSAADAFNTLFEKSRSGGIAGQLI